MDELQTPAPEAGDEVVREAEAEQSEATENTEGQVEDQPAEHDGDKPEGEEDVSPSKARRERRKAEMERLRQEAETAKREKAEIEARREKIKAQAEKSSQPPKEADFADYNEYLIALGAFQAARQWGERQVQEVEEQITAHDERAKQAEQRRQAELAQDWAAQVAEAKSRYADFDAVAMDATLPITRDVGMMIAESDQGADLLYYLGTNRQEAARISQMPPIQAARALGMIEARLSLPKPRTQSKAPDPVAPVKPKASAHKDPLKMTPDEYDAWRAAGGTF